MKLLELKGFNVEVADKRITGDFCYVQEGVAVYPPTSKGGGDFFEQLLGDDDETRVPVTVKTQRWPQDDNFMLAERTALTKLNPPDAKDEKFHRYFPKLLARHVEGGKSIHILTRETSPMVSLEEVLAAFPTGLDFRDFAWMFKRMLVGIGYAHTQGFVHGALIPPHVLIHGSERGAKLIDWCYSTRLGGKQSIRAYVKRYERYYPRSVFDKQFPTEATDLHTLGKTAIALLGGDLATNAIPAGRIAPEALAVVLKCFVGANAWDLHEEFDTVLERIVGKPAYRIFEMPHAT